VPYCVNFYPANDNLFVMGASDNRIHQWDCTSGEIVQVRPAPLKTVRVVTAEEMIIDRL
jgi:WD40 repeat protein